MTRSRVFSGPGRRRLLALGAAALLLALLDGLICARASLGRTASWAFPIDDAYIYSNYVRAAEAGHPFAYNYLTSPDERSGGMTSAGWMLMLWAAQPLTAVLGPAPADLAPQAVQRSDPALALTAGQLYLAAYGLGALFLAAAACACGWLAWECYRGRGGRTDWSAAPGEGIQAGGRPTWSAPAVLAVAAGAALLADQNAIWGSFSGLEVPLSLCLIALAPATLLYELRTRFVNTQYATRNTQPLRWSLLTAALLPWGRPELAVVGGAAAAWLGWQALRRPALRQAALAYGTAVVAGMGALAGVFWAATGRPLPSSFYAKVAGLQLNHLTDALQEWLLAHAWQPFVFLALAGLGAVVLCLWRRAVAAEPAVETAPAEPTASRPPARTGGGAAVSEVREMGCPAALVAGCAAAYFAAMLLALRWFGQEDRYILPIHALALPLALGAFWLLESVFAKALALNSKLKTLPLSAAKGQNSKLLLVVAVLALIVHVVTLRVWAASDYALFVQNIEDAHVAPAVWLAAHAPAGVVVAAEPIGAVHLFGGHPTMDLVGLTTPAQLGHYEDWAATADLLRARQAAYLLYYPHWWPDGHALPWARLVQSFPVPDNRIAGDSLIAVYALIGP